MTKLANPVPIFLDGRGALLDGGYIFIGAATLDPEVAANQLPLFTDQALTVPIAQPLRTLGGVVVNGLDLAEIFFAAADFSTTVRDADENLVYYKPSAFDTGGSAFQPLDSDLSAIAALATTDYGRALLTLANQAALRGVVGTGTAAYLDEATPAQYRDNTADKVITTDVAWAAAVPVSVPWAASIALSFAAGINFVIAPLTGNTTLDNPTNVKPGQSGFVEIRQDATGGRTMTFAANWRFAGGVDPVLTVNANARDILNYEVLSDSIILASLTKAIG